MLLHYIDSILNADADVIVNPITISKISQPRLHTNAWDLKLRYPQNIVALRSFMSKVKNAVELGTSRRYWTGSDCENESRIISNVFVRKDTRSAVKHEVVYACIRAAFQDAQIAHKNSIAIPLIGCEFGGISCKAVWDAIQREAEKDKYKHMTVIVYITPDQANKLDQYLLTEKQAV